MNGILNSALKMAISAQAWEQQVATHHLALHPHIRPRPGSVLHDDDDDDNDDDDDSA
jgi:hypothetical protein